MKPKAGLRILLVEDHEDTLVAMKSYLEGQGHVVHEARDLATAREIAKKARFQVLLSDIRLPDGDGWELLMELRKTRTFQAIAMSGFGQKTDLDRSSEAGFIRHLTKPFKVDELDAALKKARSLLEQ